MPIEVWAAIAGALLMICATIAGSAWRVSLQVGKAITKVEVIGTLQASEIKEIKASVEGLKSVVTTVAVQKNELQSLREMVNQLQARTDTTFDRVFTLIDKPRTL